MIVIDKAILHILDVNESREVFSDTLLNMDTAAVDFMVKHIEKTVSSQDAKKGSFYENSEFKKLVEGYSKGEMEFIPFSREAAGSLYKVLVTAEGIASADLLICDALIDETRYLVIFKCNNHQGYVHQINIDEDGLVTNELVNNYAILPGLSQKIDEFVFINLTNMEVMSKSKKYNVDGNSIYLIPELFLECAQTPSPAETIKEINRVVKKVTEAYCQDQVAAAAAVKNFIADNIQSEAVLDPVAVGKEVFHDNPSMQADYSQAMENAGFSEPVEVNQEATLRKMKKHKLSTDTGIEITIPTDYFENTDFVEFFKEDDGSMSITLKNIQNIINR
ncbi:MAG: nucleoid-associated protein [Anaerovibrio sp.]|uniref:nucleoid-associated protein n=1 Tax=Anaerovibrio sp. TaxID=1872532 RepID=UPI0025DB0DFB|nr:nucleoid-associated protein [Anaerovibrio sp.]MCR5176368.1 nucleoid-associated protein [Anaerovibrio sp.]